MVIVVAKNSNSARLLNPLKSNLVFSKAVLKNETKTKTINTMKEIKTNSGGIKFIQSKVKKPVI